MSDCSGTLCNQDGQKKKKTWERANHKGYSKRAGEGLRIVMFQIWLDFH